MALSLSTQLAIRQALEVVGGATESIFPQVEALLLSDADYQRALEFVASRKNMNAYQSMVDFLFCELNPLWKSGCRRYYAGMGKPLRDQITIDELIQFNKQMLMGLELAHLRFVEKRKQSWPSFVLDIEEALFLAS